MADSNIVVSALAVTNGFGQNFLTWSYSDPNVQGLPYLRLDTVEVWAATTNDRSTATKVVEGIVSAIDIVTDGSARWYWIKARNQSAYYGDWYPSDAAGGIAAAQTALIDTTGYIKLPSGLIIQWGFSFIISAQQNIVTFPTPFPSQCFLAYAWPASIDNIPFPICKFFQILDGGWTQAAVILSCRELIFQPDGASGNSSAIDPVTGTSAVWLAIGN